MRKFCGGGEQSALQDTLAWGLSVCGLCLWQWLCAPSVAPSQPRAGSVSAEFRQPGRKTWVLTNFQSLQNEVKTFQEAEETSGSGSQQNAFLELFPIGKHTSVLIVMTSLVLTALD